MKKIVAALLNHLSRNSVISSASGRRILASGGLTILALVGALVFTVHGKLSPAFACFPTAYSVTSSAPPPLGFWTDTSGAVWSPAGGFPGCATGDSASDNNPIPTTLIINSAIPNALTSIIFNSNGSTIEIDPGGSLTLSGGGNSLANGSKLHVNGGTLTLSNGSLIIDSTNFQMDSGTVDVQANSGLFIGSGTQMNGGTLNLDGGSMFSTGSTSLTLSNGATLVVGADTSVNDVGFIFTGSSVLQLDHDLTVNTTVQMNGSSTSTGTGDVIGSVKRTGFVGPPTPNTLSFGNPNNEITIASGVAPADITVNLVKSAPAFLPSAV